MFLIQGGLSFLCWQPHETVSPSLNSPSIRNVFYNKVKTRPQTPRIARQYIISKNMFEFGPLLMNKNSSGEGKPSISRSEKGAVHLPEPYAPPCTIIMIF